MRLVDIGPSKVWSFCIVDHLEIRRNHQCVAANGLKASKKVSQMRQPFDASRLSFFDRQGPRHGLEPLQLQVQLPPSLRQSRPAGRCWCQRSITLLTRTNVSKDSSCPRRKTCTPTWRKYSIRRSAEGFSVKLPVTELLLASSWTIKKI